MYHAQAGMFAILMLNHEQLAKLHGMALGIPRIDESVYKCEPILGKLFTNASGVAAWPADMPYYGTPPPTPPSSQYGGRTKDCTRLPIPEGCSISEFANGQSGDHQPQPMAEDLLHR